MRIPTDAPEANSRSRLEYSALSLAQLFRPFKRHDATELHKLINDDWPCGIPDAAKATKTKVDLATIVNAVNLPRRTDDFDVVSGQGALEGLFVWPLRI